MDTNQLVRSLAADHGWTAKRVSGVLFLVLALALACSMAMFSFGLHVRPDVRVAMGHPFFMLKFIVTLTLAAAALILALRLVRPGAPIRHLPWLLALPAALLAGGIAMDLALPQASTWTTRLIGSNARVCLIAIPLLSVPLLIAALAGLRHGAATRPTLTGAIAGLVAGGLAATLYASHCTDDSPLFVATWYTIGIGIVALVGALAGRWVLRL
jgi:hypothetical protein